MLPALMSASANHPHLGEPHPAETRLRERERELELAKATFEEEQRLLRDYWRRQHRAEWERLRAEAKRMAEAASSQQHALQEKQSELELRRRELEQAHREFQQERAAWREEQARQQADLNAMRQSLRNQESEVDRAEIEFKRARQVSAEVVDARVAEAVGLEKRIAAFREQLALVRAEVVWHHANADSEGREPAEPFLPLDATSAVLARVSAVLDELFTEHLRLVDLRTELLEVRESWTLEWERAEQVLARRELEASEEADEVNQRQLTLRRLVGNTQQQLEEIQAKQRLLRAQAEELIRERTNLRCQRGALAAKLRARSWAARNRARLAERLLHELQRHEVLRLARQQEAEQTLRLSQQALFARHAQLDAREASLDEREKELQGREWVVRYSEEQLITGDPQPKAAEEELRRRLDIFLKLARQAEHRRQARAAEQAGGLKEVEEIRGRLLATQADVEAEQVQLSLLRLDTLRQKLELQRERENLRIDGRRYRNEREILRRQNRDLAEQVERLTLLLMENPPAVRPALAA